MGKQIVGRIVFGPKRKTPIDAERDRLARIGELVEGLVATYDVGLSVNDHGATVWLTPDGMSDSEQANRPTLLAALKSLKERCG